MKLTWDVFPPETHIVIKHRVGLKGVILEDPGTQKQTEGTIEVTPDPPVTVYTIVATGPGNQKAKKREIIINVLEAPKPPKPQIKTFTVDQDTVHAGEQVTFRWEGQGTEFIIDPGNVRLNQYARTFQTIPEKDTTYELRAHVEGNVITAAKVVKVKVVSKDVCIADINSFKPKNPDVYIGDKVKLRWSVHNARSVRIDVDHGEPIGEVRPGDAGVEATINDPTTYRLTATDSVGKTVSKDITVVPRQRPPAQETTPPLGGDTGTNAPEVRRTP